MAEQRCLDLAQLDPNAPDLDLVVDAAKVFDVAILETARQIAAAVQRGPWCGAEQVGNEALRGELGAVEIAARNARAVDIDFAGHPDGGGLPVRIEDVDLGIADRASDQNRIDKECHRMRNKPD